MKKLEEQYRAKKKKSFANTMDKVFLSKIKMAPIWFYALVIGFILNGATNTGMNKEYWKGEAWFGDARVLTVIGGALIFYACVGIVWFVVRLLSTKK